MPDATAPKSEMPDPRPHLGKIPLGGHRPIYLVGWLARTLELARALLGMATRRRPGRGDRDLYALGVVRSAIELGRGVLAEGIGGRAGNAMRLARHLFEQELELHYVLDQPLPRLDQLRASEAKRRLQLVELNPGIEGRGAPLEEFDSLVARAKALNHTAKQKPVWERGFLPGYEDMATALDRQDDYNLYYRAASWLSHPGLAGSGLYFEDDGITLRPLDAPSSPEDVAQALSLGLGFLVNLLERANWCLGPAPGFDATLKQLQDDIAAGKEPRESA